MKAYTRFIPSCLAIVNTAIKSKFREMQRNFCLAEQILPSLVGLWFVELIGCRLKFSRTLGSSWGVGGQPHAPAASTSGENAVPIVQAAGWAPGPVWTGVKCRPHRHSIPNRPARSQSLYRPSYRAPTHLFYIHTKLNF